MRFWTAGCASIVLMLVAKLLFADIVTVSRDTAHVKEDPIRDATVITTVRRGDQFLLLDNGRQENGYYHVQVPNSSEDGWIYRNRVRRTTGLPSPVSAIPHEGDRIEFGTLPVGPNTMAAHFIDVGQGDATLLEFSCGAILIDTGGEDTTDVDGSANLTRFLDVFFERRSDLNDTLALLAITHPHRDHTRTIPEILSAYTVMSAIDNGLRNGSGRFQQRHLQDNAEGLRIAYLGIAENDIELASGLSNDFIDPVDCDGTDPEVRVLWGSLDEDDGWPSGAFDNGNNHSLVIRIDFGESSFLFTGDLQEAAIDGLVHAYSGFDTLDVDVYQVGHHGSHNATTKELMEEMTPRIAVISMGNSNLSQANHSAFSYAHPRDEAVAHLMHDDYGVTGLRARTTTVPIGVKGACRSCNPRRPPRFDTWTITEAIYATGWDGNVQISATSAGHMVVR